MTKRIEWVDVYKGILILLVVLGHAIQEPLKVRGIGFEDNIWRNIIYSFHMPAFMAMSGYLLYRPNVIGGGGINHCISIIYRRFKQLMLPFFIWSIPLYLVYGNVEYIWDYVLYPNKGYWFLWTLFFIIVIYVLVNSFCERAHIKQEIAMAGVAVVLIGCQMLLPDAKLLGYEYIAFYFLFFMMGYYANKYKGYLPKSNVAVWSLFALWAIMACFWTPNELPVFLKGVPYVSSRLIQLGYRMLTPIVFILWMYSVAPKITVGCSWIWKRIIEIGQISLGIYVVHMVVKNLFARMLLATLPMLPIWAHVVIEFVLLTVLSIMVVWLIMKNKYTARWLLGKL